MRQAVTTQPISGRAITTIPAGTLFQVITEVPDYGYATCTGLGVTAVWLTEFEYVN